MCIRDSSKLLVVLLTLLTGVAAASLLIRGPVGDVAASWVSTDPSPWTLANLAFLIPLMGWMPGPVEMCVWPSLWMFSRARHRAHRDAEGGRVRFQPRLWRHRGDGDVLRDPGGLHDVRQR